MKKSEFIDAIEIKSPCDESWDEMTGNSKVRFCSHCSKNVNNISAMRRKDAMSLIRREKGRLCVRYQKDPATGTPIFLDSLHQITRRAPYLTAGAMATSLAMATAAYAQGEPIPVTMSGNVVINATASTEAKTTSLSGAVTDQNGAAIPYAIISLINEFTGEYRSASASSEGVYEFKSVPPGRYKLRFEAGGFETKEIADLEISDGNNLRRDAQLSVPQIAEVVNVSGSVELQEFVTMGIVVCVEAQNPLVQAVLSEDLENVKARVMMRARINVKDKTYDGMTPLHAAVETGNLEILQFLLERGAKPNIRDFQKRTPLMMMDEDATPELLDLLVRYGAKVHLVDKQGNNVLHHFAAYDESVEIVRQLAALGANYNASNKQGITPLMIAAENGNTDTVRVLLELGAGVDQTDREGKSALDRAEEPEVRSLLESHGAIARKR